MYKRNNGSTEQEILQNEFTAYLITSIHREKIAYLKQKSRRLNMICKTEDDMIAQIPDETDFVSLLCESDALAYALNQLDERERYVLLARAVADKDFEEIADKLGLKYKGVAAIYYRTTAKLRNILGGN